MILEENINEDEIRNTIMAEEALRDKQEEDEDIERESKAISEQKRVVRYLEQVSGMHESSDEEEVEQREPSFVLNKENQIDKWQEEYNELKQGEQKELIQEKEDSEEMEKRENIKMIEENNQIQDMLQKARKNAEREI